MIPLVNSSYAGWQPHLIPDFSQGCLQWLPVWHDTCFGADMCLVVGGQLFCLTNNLNNVAESKIYTNMSVNFYWPNSCYIDRLWLIHLINQCITLISFVPFVFQWSDKPCVPHLLQRDSYYVYTQQELKEKLYQEIISYFDKGKVSVHLFVFMLGEVRH